MDAYTETRHTAGMEADTKTVAQLLALARDITQETLGHTPEAVLAEVFRQLCREREYGQSLVDAQAAPLH